MRGWSSPLPFLCKTAAGAVKGEKPIVLFSGYPALVKVEYAVQTILDLKIALYQLFYFSTFVHET